MVKFSLDSALMISSEMVFSKSKIFPSNSTALLLYIMAAILSLHRQKTRKHFNPSRSVLFRRQTFIDSDYKLGEEVMVGKRHAGDLPN